MLNMVHNKEEQAGENGKKTSDKIGLSGSMTRQVSPHSSIPPALWGVITHLPPPPAALLGGGTRLSGGSWRPRTPDLSPVGAGCSRIIDTYEISLSFVTPVCFLQSLNRRRLTNDLLIPESYGNPSTFLPTTVLVRLTFFSDFLPTGKFASKYPGSIPATRPSGPTFRIFGDGSPNTIFRYKTRLRISRTQGG